MCDMSVSERESVGYLGSFRTNRGLFRIKRGCLRRNRSLIQHVQDKRDIRLALERVAHRGLFCG